MTQTPPRRRWFRFAFSLRTMFVLVTLVACACYPLWQWNIVRQRRSLLLELMAAAGPSNTHVMQYEAVANDRVGGIRAIELPLLRKAMGDTAVSGLSIPHTFDAGLIARVAAVFPEAECEVTVEPALYIRFETAAK